MKKSKRLCVEQHTHKISNKENTMVIEKLMSLEAISYYVSFLRFLALRCEENTTTNKENN